MAWDLGQPKLTEEVKPPETKKEDFKFEESEQSSKEVFCIYGKKGVGKTVLALSFPGTITALSFDKKTMMPKMNFFKNDPRIKVFDAVKFYERGTDEKNESSEKTYNYVIFLLDEIAKSKPDWILIDGVEIMSKIAEGVMRFRHKLSPYQGITNLNIWKERNDVVAQIHRRAVDACKKGVIYTTYTQLEEIVQEGSIVTRLEVPKYIDEVMWETDFVLHIINNFDEKTKKSKFMLRIVSSKNDTKMPTGIILDITGVKDIVQIFPNMK